MDDKENDPREGATNINQLLGLILIALASYLSLQFLNAKNSRLNPILAGGTGLIYCAIVSSYNKRQDLNRLQEAQKIEELRVRLEQSWNGPNIRVEGFDGLPGLNYEPNPTPNSPSLSPLRLPTDKPFPSTYLSAKMEEELLEQIKDQWRLYKAGSSIIYHNRIILKVAELCLCKLADTANDKDLHILMLICLKSEPILITDDSNMSTQTRAIIEQIGYSELDFAHLVWQKLLIGINKKIESFPNKDKLEFQELLVENGDIYIMFCRCFRREYTTHKDLN